VSHPDLSIGDEVAAALADRRAVVAMESTIYSGLGLPSPANEEALARCSAAIRDAGAVPAMVAVLDGRWQVGVAEADVERVLAARTKIAERDLAVAAATALPAGVTTVSGTLAVAAAAGIEVFATGGIGGVHRHSELTGDVSADLQAIARHPVVTTCAGAKAFLDLPKTVELLDTLGVPLLGWRHEWFPAFYTRSSGLPVQHRVESAEEVAAIVRHRPDPARGVLLAAPIPEAAELDGALLDGIVADALAAVDAAGVQGAAVTPFVLARLEEATGGTSVIANLALAEHNASVAAQVAVALTAPEARSPSPAGVTGRSAA
jgi:pseudouridine-5'-phosphate glycosidase